MHCRRQLAVERRERADLTTLVAADQEKRKKGVGRCTMLGHLVRRAEALGELDTGWEEQADVDEGVDGVDSGLGEDAAISAGLGTRSQMQGGSVDKNGAEDDTTASQILRVVGTPGECKPIPWSKYAKTLLVRALPDRTHATNDHSPSDDVSRPVACSDARFGQMSLNHR